MKIDMFALGLLAVSTFTGLLVEAIKAMLTEFHVTMQRPNTVAGIVAIVLAVTLGVCYALYQCIPWTTQYILEVIALAVLSWLCSMLGYDKVIQTIEQLKR